MTLIKTRQLQTIAELIIDICARAEARKEINFHEKKNIIQFTSQCTAMAKLLEDLGLI